MATIHRIRPEIRPRQAAAISASVSAQIESWLLRTSRAHNISIERWGNMSGVSPTGLTRFLRDGYPVPKATTLAKLAAAIGERAAELAMSNGLARILVIDGRIAREQGMRAAMDQAAETTQVPEAFASCMAVRIPGDRSVLAGVLPGDLVVFDPCDLGQGDDLVLALLEDGEAVLLRRAGPLLIPQGHRERTAIEAEAVQVLGRAVQVQRDLR